MSTISTKVALKVFALVEILLKFKIKKLLYIYMSITSYFFFQTFSLDLAEFVS